jgi:DNA polymerase-3 subunit delta'
VADTNWNDIVGLEQIKNNLQNAIKYNKISHAYMIQGEKLSGKMMVAEIFARALQCEATNGAKPCNECRSCRQALNRNHPDIIYVEHDKPNVISVDNIRQQINSDVAIKPYSGPKKI